MNKLVEAFYQIDWTNPSWDLFIILFFVVAAFFYGFSLGKDRILVILVSIYMSLAVVSYAPFISDFSAEISINQGFVFKITSFLVIFLVLFFIISRSAVSRTLGAADVQGNLIQVIIFSCLYVGLLISIVMSYLPDVLLNKFAPLTQQIFTSEIGRLAWIGLPIIAMVILGRNKEK